MIVKHKRKLNLESGIGKSLFLIIVLVCFGFFFISLCIVANAEEKEAESYSLKEIVVLLDCSQSMEDVDASYAAFDFARSLSAILPREYRVGVVAYRDEVCVSQPLGSSHEMIESALTEVEYSNYGNAGAGLSEAVGLFDRNAADKRIILISDGEMMMKTEEGTQESAELFEQAVEEAESEGITIDVIALGERIEEGHTVYFAARATDGSLYELADGEELGNFAETLLFEQWKLKASHVGQINGLSGELIVRLPDCLMSTAKIALIGSQQNENMTLNCEAERIDTAKGAGYTVIELKQPSSDEVKIQMSADTSMNVRAYLTAEYDFNLHADYRYVPEEQTASFKLDITNKNGQGMAGGHLKDGGVQVCLDGDEQTYQITDGAICFSKQYEKDAVADIKVSFDNLYGNYYGDAEETVEIIVPVMEEEPPEIDWFFWSVIGIFIAALLIILVMAYRQRKRIAGKRKFIDESRTLPRETTNRRNEFNGKLQIYVIHSKDEVDYPPESINLFARCNREMLTLEWLLDVCSLPFNLRGAERIIIRPGDDRSLVIKNNSKASVLMGRELLMKGHAYHLYYGEKVTFIFDQEDTEIEVHYRDLKPNER